MVSAEFYTEESFAESAYHELKYTHIKHIKEDIQLDYRLSPDNMVHH